MTSIAGDERRKDFRAEVPVCLSLDVPVALSCEAVQDDDANIAQWQWDELAVAPDLVKAMVDEKDFTIRDPLLFQMVARIDWMLTSVLKTLGKDKTFGQAIPEFLTVNISGSGIRFPSSRKFEVGNVLILRLILRPFIPIQAIAKVLRVRHVFQGGEQRFETAAEFTKIADDDREALIRHILRTQAALQRLRSIQTDPAVVG